jgi:site-specific DNA-methyltransferase (adenine-specific)
MTKMIIDHEFKALNRKLNESEYKKLEASIIQEGVRDPLVLWNEILIDGHNRLDIATKHNINYSTINNDTLSDREEVKTWIINNQLGRRNLTPNEVSYYRGKLYESQKRQGNRTDLTSGNYYQKSTAEVIAERYGVSEKTIRNDAEFSKAIDKVEAEAGSDIKDAILSGVAGVPKKDVEDVIKVKREAPELMPKLESGEMTISKAFKELRKAEREDKRTQLAQSAQNLPADDRWCVEQGDINNYRTDKQFDFIITDPPYPKEYLQLYEVLAVRAKEWLKPGGLLIAMCGQSYLNQIYEMMSKHLDYYWTAAYLTPGQSASLWQKNVIPQWKPLLIFAKGEYSGKMFGDVYSSGANEKELHKWGQSESGMYSIISGVCLPGQSILDPFCGAGTTGIAAIRRGCLFHGIDIDQQNVDISIGRLHDS